MDFPDNARYNENLNSIRNGYLLDKPGWIRLSIHPTMTNKEIDFILHSIESTANNFQDWMKEYTYDPVSNEYSYRGNNTKEQGRVKDWFNVSRWVYTHTITKKNLINVSLKNNRSLGGNSVEETSRF